MTNGKKSIFKPDGRNAIHDGIEHAPGGGKALLDSTDTVMLLLDHQSGLFQNVKDITVAELRAMGLDDLIAADWNGDGIVDLSDADELASRPPAAPSGEEGAAAPVDSRKHR